MTSASETAARIRAARGYSGLTQKQLAQKLGYSVETLSRTENGRRTPEPGEIERIVALCGVPIEFMQTGFQLIIEHGRRPSQADLVERLQRAMDRINAMQGEIASLQEAQVEAVVSAVEVRERLAAVEGTIRRLQPRKRS